MTERTAGEAESMIHHLTGRLLASLATWLLFALLAILPTRNGQAQDAVYFVKHVRPIFQQRCYGCHGSKSQKSDLRLDLRSAAMRGGQIYGESWIAGDPENSPLIQVVESLDPAERMPPEGEPLTAAQRQILRQWIAQGSIWPEGVDESKEVDRSDWWSFQPLHVPTGLVDIDRLVDEVLASKGLKRSPPATKGQWLRRVTLDLTGLLPTPQELEQFLEDSGEDSWERVVDRLLASPRYGERWGQHWLDVVRYADTHGFEVNTERPNAWPYRDYVIDAMNRDLPYDRFILQQIAGDQQGVDEATGFLITASVLLPGQIGQDEPSKRLARQDALDEIVNNIGQTFLGLSIGCARCHDHKFDPITARDYYAMQAFVAGVEYLDRPWRNRSLLSDPESLGRSIDQLRQARQPLLEGVAISGQALRRPRINAAENLDRSVPVHAKFLRFEVLATNRLEPCIDELEVFDLKGENIALASCGTIVRSSGDRNDPGRHELRFVHDGNYGNESSWMSSEVGRGWVELEFAEAQSIAWVAWGRDRQRKYTDRLATDYRISWSLDGAQWIPFSDAMGRDVFEEAAVPDPFDLSHADPATKQLRSQQIERREQVLGQLREATAIPQVFAGVFRRPDTIHLLLRGDPEQPKEEIGPAVPEVFVGRIAASKPEDLWWTKPQSLSTPEEPARREALGRWLASEQHPLTARVLVNRLWQGHFGTGLVATPSDFGHQGSPPTHPRLLDWLASQLIQSEWSIKRIQRMIVLSQVYRQSSFPDPESMRVDRESRWLWRFPSRRMEAEAIRDCILQVSGLLDFKMHGKGYDLFDLRGGLSGFRPVEQFSGDGLRRMVYAHKVRRERDGVFGTFDCPDAGQSTSRRRESTTPLQSLSLFNSRFVMDQSEQMARRLQEEAPGGLEDQVRQAFWVVLGRQPTAEELDEALQLAEPHSLAQVVRVLLNCNEFLMIP
jgi:hypothetical protein